MRVARRLRITGVVQGVGFRPFVQRLAVDYALTGWVRNALGEVEAHIEGAPADVQAFIDDMPRRRPTLARIDTLDVAEAEPTPCVEFTILASSSGAHAPLPVPADVVICDACAAEIADPSNRRFQYPFTTCTDCGPRYTVIESLPYDRERTSLRVFPLCPACAAEYAAPDNRRFHAESTSCPVCGPHLTFERVDGTNVVNGDADALDAAAESIQRGEIVALRGLGGFHLAVDATNAGAVMQLRARKHREAKPLACMVATVDDAARWVHMTAAERQALTARERPIVLVTPRSDVRDRLAEGLAPGLDRIGLMLPSTPLHLLLAQRVGKPMVMTSGNISDEPLAAGNVEARERLAAIADALLTHDREIVARIDDSVVRLAGETPILLRRARGHAPLSLTVPIASPVPVLAVGAHLKNTFTLLHQRQAFVSPHIGDLDSLDTLTHWHAVLARYQTLFGVTPSVIAADMHEGYLSTRAAEDMLRDDARLQVIRVQHHHAHVAAIAAEHGIDAPVLGVALDGTGAGTDGTVWGGEFLHADLTGFLRVGHVRPFALAGGDLAVRSPWRSLLGLRSLEPDAFASHALETTNVSTTEAQLAARQIERSLNAPITSSMGRVFDAISSLIGVCHHARFEGEAAMRLEACAGRRVGTVLPFPVIVGDDGVRQLDPVPLLVALYELRAAGTCVEQLAADAHDSIVVGLLTMIEQLADACGTNLIALGGGCFQNARLLESMTGRLRAIGLRALIAHSLPANDGGVSYGQAAIAAACLADGRRATAGAEQFSLGAEFDRRASLSH